MLTSLSYFNDLFADGRIRIENLKPNTSYTLSVRAKTEVGVGGPIELTVSTDTISMCYSCPLCSSSSSIY